MNIILKIYNTQDEDLQGKLEQISIRADDYTSGILDDGSTWELVEDDNCKIIGMASKINELIAETKEDIKKLDQTEEIEFEKGYISALEYILSMLHLEV